MANAFEDIERYDWLVFTSPSGVRIFFDEMVDAAVDCRPSRAKFAALGQGTASELRKHGFIADLVPEGATGEALGEALAEAAAEPGARSSFPRARIGNKELVEALLRVRGRRRAHLRHRAARGGFVDFAGAVRAGRDLLRGVHQLVGRARFAKANPDLDLTSVQAACIGEKTRATAESLGMSTWMSETATMDSLTELIVSQFAAR